MFFKFFDLGDGLWLKLSMTVKLKNRFITGVKHWTQESGKPMPLFLNTAVTNSPDVKITDLQGFAARLFLQNEEVKGFSSPHELLVELRRNGHIRLFHAKWNKEESEDGRTLFKFNAWEERTEEKRVFNPTMADALNNRDKKRRQIKEEPLDRKAVATYKLRKQQLACAD
jgi:hypothetical protein